MIIALAMPEQYNKREIESSPKKKLFFGCVSETDSLLFLALKGAGAPSQRFVQGGRNTEHLFTPRERLLFFFVVPQSNPGVWQSELLCYLNLSQ
jgi:hypothetical protein